MPDAELTPLELKIARMWESGMDTLDISRAQGVPFDMMEHDVYRMLPRIRAKRRAQREASA